MSSMPFLGLALVATALAAEPVNFDGSTGERAERSGPVAEAPEFELEVDLSDPSVRGTLPSAGWVSALGFEMRGRSSALDFATSTNSGSMWCLTGSVEQFADIRLHVPHNARISFFRMWGFDGSDTHNLAAFLFESCLPNLSAGSPSNTVLADLQSSGNPGSFTQVINLASPQPVTDTRNCTYWARVRYANECADGLSLILRKFRITYTVVP